MPDDMSPREQTKQISVKVPLHVWQSYRMRAIHEGSSVQSVVSRVLESGISEWPALDMGAFSPAAKEGNRVAGPPPPIGRPLTCREVDARPEGGWAECGAALAADGSCPRHGLPPTQEELDAELSRAAAAMLDEVDQHEHQDPPASVADAEKQARVKAIAARRNKTVDPIPKAGA